MKVIKEVSSIQKISGYYNCIGKKIALVPTMGYLHPGHISLMKRAKAENDILVVSIFVNPKQFGKNEDYDKYPRDFERDYNLCKDAGADYIFNPEVFEIYKKSNRTDVVVNEITDKLEGKFRPGHFTGVATIVTKLLNAVKPDNLYLGQKDAQQNAVIKKLIEDLNVECELTICETMRERNGLAMSSRNTYLTDKEKEDASVLYSILNQGKELILNNNGIDSETIKKYICNTLEEKAPDFKLEYYEITDNTELEALTDLENYEGEVLISLAVRVRNIRLIDNIIFKKTKNEKK